ncbi:hypothetical protein AB6N31_09495 [Fusobacterium animalis]
MKIFEFKRKIEYNIEIFAANLIILQINGSNRSQIEGYLEALSRQKVDVILSDENGLYINNGNYQY